MLCRCELAGVELGRGRVELKVVGSQVRCGAVLLLPTSPLCVL